MPTTVVPTIRALQTAMESNGLLNKVVNTVSVNQQINAEAAGAAKPLPSPGAGRTRVLRGILYTAS